jgi:glycosyltransferase involved in cell wall biosynthesis
MRIVHFLTHTHTCNGNVHVAVDLACIQAKMGHSVSVISGGGDFDSLLAAHRVKHVVIDLKRTPRNLVVAIRKLDAALSLIAPDIVHAHMMTSAVLAAAFRPVLKFKLITTVHNEFDRGAILMGMGNRVIAVSQAVAEKMRRRGLHRSKLRVVLNGTIGSPRLSSATPAVVKLMRPAITFVGGLHPRKGLEDLIEAFQRVSARVPSASLYLVGEGPYRSLYEQWTARIGLGDRIRFCGFQADPRTYLNASDIFVLASHAEPGALVLVEAREAGCAIVATAVDGVPEMLDYGRAGILVPPKRPDLLAEAIVALLDSEPALQEMRRRASANLEHFTVERVARECLSVYAGALTGSSDESGVSLDQRGGGICKPSGRGEPQYGESSATNHKA